MKTAYACALTLLAATAFHAAGASALSVDDTSMNKSGDSAKFSDPDEQSPIQLGTSANMAGTASGNTDPSSVRYDYDPASGSFAPHKN